MAGRRRNGVPIAMGSCFLYAAQIQEGLLYQVAMTMGRFKISLLLLALVCLPGTLLGNGLTPMMMGTSAHLLLGNILIGLLEGGLLKWRIGDKAYRPVVVMIGANYFSMLIGMFLCDSQSARLHSNLLYFQACFVLMVYLMWLVTVLLEWPFVWLAMGRGLRRWGKALGYSFVLQSVSYILLVGWYMLCGNHSLLTCERVSPREIRLPENVCIYYISKYDGGVYKLDSTEDEPMKIANLPHQLTEEEKAREYKAFLVWLADENAPEKANLVERIQGNAPENITILSRCADVDKVLLSQIRDTEDSIWYYDANRRSYCDAELGRPLGKARDANCRFMEKWFNDTGLFLLERCQDEDGVSRENPVLDAHGFAWKEWKTTRKLFAMDSPLAMHWKPRNIIQFENDIILFEFPNCQLCLFDYRTRRIARLARGYGATAAIK